jgi:hypothetical protein
MMYLIIVDDKFVMVDGVRKAPVEFDIDPSIHAVRWSGESGEIEFRSEPARADGTPVPKPLNEKFTDPDRFQSVIDAHKEKE